MNTTATLNPFADYAAAPAAENFQPQTIAELKDRRAEYGRGVEPEWDEARTANWLMDVAALDLAITMAADGVQILMARDEDGLYFATAEPVWRVFSPCGARRWFTASDAQTARVEAEAWVAEGDWEDGEEVHAFCEPFTGLDEDGDATTDDWKREGFTVRG